MGPTEPFADLILKEEGPVTEITLNRPEKRNALSLSLMKELTAALGQAGGRVIVIGGAGAACSPGRPPPPGRGGGAGLCPRALCSRSGVRHGPPTAAPPAPPTAP